MFLTTDKSLLFTWATSEVSCLATKFSPLRCSDDCVQVHGQDFLCLLKIPQKLSAVTQRTPFL